jgi:hypothetical protein
MFAAIVDGVYTKVKDLHKAISNQNNITKGYELELT